MTTTTPIPDSLTDFDDEITTPKSIPYCQSHNHPNLSLTQNKITFYMTHFAAHQEFTDLGEPTNNSLVSAVD